MVIFMGYVSFGEGIVFNVLWIMNDVPSLKLTKTPLKIGLNAPKGKESPNH